MPDPIEGIYYFEGWFYSIDGLCKGDPENGYKGFKTQGEAVKAA
jgi:hypothetical protein